MKKFILTHKTDIFLTSIEEHNNYHNSVNKNKTKNVNKYKQQQLYETNTSTTTTYQPSLEQSIHIYQEHGSIHLVRL